MLPAGTDGLYRRALAAPHTEYVLVEVLDGAGNVLPLPRGSRGAEGGLIVQPDSSIQATLTSRVTRQATVTVDESLYPDAATGLLAPYGNRIRATRGIEFADGNRYAWTVFTGRIQQTLLSPDGTVSAYCSDRAQEIIEAGLVVPEPSQAGATVNAEFIRLVSDALVDAVFGASDALVRASEVTRRRSRSVAR